MICVAFYEEVLHPVMDISVKRVFLHHEVTELKLKVGNSTAVYGLSYGKPLLRARWVIYFVLIRHRSQSSHLLRHPTPVFKANFFS